MSDHFIAAAIANRNRSTENTIRIPSVADQSIANLHPGQVSVLPRANALGSIARTILLAIGLAAGFILPASAQNAESAVASRNNPAGSNRHSPLGINLESVKYHSSEQPFIDIMKTGGIWYTQVPDSWDTNEQQFLRLDAIGWPTSVNSGIGGQAVRFTRVSTLLLNALPPPYYPAGQYVALYDGTGDITYSFDAVKNTALSAPGRDVLDVTPSDRGILVTIAATDPHNTGDHVRNIRLVKATNEALLAAGKIFNPDFISRIAPFRAIRFMTWMTTNNSTQSKWTERPLPGDAFWGTAKGVPLDVMVALANTLQVDPWFNMPHMATDDYVTQFADLAHRQLASNKHVYVEYSNETWYPIFSQTDWVQARGQELWPSASARDANLNYSGMRSAQMCDIWKRVWGADANRVVCVSASNAENSYTARQALACPLWTEGAPCHKHGFSALAIAPYFGYDVPASWTSDPDGGLGKLFTEINQGGLAPDGFSGGMIAKAIDSVTANKAVANQFNLDLIAYEAGPTLANPNNPVLTTLYISANRDLRMGAAITSYLRQWKAEGGNFVTYFQGIGSYSKWGSWGALENVMQTSSPKYDALLGFIAANPCWWDGCNHP